MDKSDIVIVGSAALFPKGEFGDKYSTREYTVQNATPINRKLRRYMNASIPMAIQTAEYAFDDAGIDPKNNARNWGVYAGQFGYLHPHLSDFIPAFKETNPDSVETAFSQAWNSSKVSPFIVTNMLNNNLLGLISLHWGIVGDCGAYVRDAPGAASALRDAIYSLRNGYCDIALVICSGADEDVFLNDLVNETGEALDVNEALQAGAVALILEKASNTVERGAGIKAHIDLLGSGYCAKDLMESISNYKGETSCFETVVHDLTPCDENIELEAALDAIESNDVCNLSVINGARGCQGIMSTIIASLSNNVDEVTKNTTLVVSSVEGRQVSAAIIHNE